MSFENTASYRKQMFLSIKKIVTSKKEQDVKNNVVENLQVECIVHECDYVFKGSHKYIISKSTQHYKAYHGSPHDKTSVNFTSINKKVTSF